MTNGGEAVSLYTQQGVLVLRIADVYNVVYGTENSIQAHNPTYLNDCYLYAQFYAVNNFNCRNKVCKYAIFWCVIMWSSNREEGIFLLKRDN